MILGDAAHTLQANSGKSTYQALEDIVAFNLLYLLILPDSPRVEVLSALPPGDCIKSAIRKSRASSPRLATFSS
jgi:hypothetical protein